ncbi:MAG: hypothetical protein ACRC23_01470 [Aeromonas jandaei]
MNNKLYTLKKEMNLGDLKLIAGCQFKIGTWDHGITVESVLNGMVFDTSIPVNEINEWFEEYNG